MILIELQLGNYIITGLINTFLHKLKLTYAIQHMYFNQFLWNFRYDDYTHLSLFRDYFVTL